MAKISRDETEAKQKVRTEITKANRALTQHPQRRNQFQTNDDELVVYVVFSRSDQLWYGIPEKYIEEWQSKFQRGFVLFAAGSGECVYVVPLHLLVEALHSERRTPVGNRGFELHLLDDQGVFREIPTLHLVPFRNSYFHLIFDRPVKHPSGNATQPRISEQPTTHVLVEAYAVPPSKEITARTLETAVDNQDDSHASKITIAPELYDRLQAYAQDKGISIETLVNLWLLEKLYRLDTAR